MIGQVKGQTSLFWRRLHVMLVSFFSEQGVQYLRLPHAVPGLVGKFWSVAEKKISMVYLSS